MPQLFAHLGKAMRTVFAVVGLFLNTLWVGCTFNQPVDELTMSVVEPHSDTLSAFPTVRLAFSAPLHSGYVSMTLTPDPGLVWHTALNASRDTLTFITDQVLQGETTYILAPAHTLESRDGAFLSAGDATVRFTTHAVELEPNDTRATAQVLDRVRCATISTVHDTDTFIWENPGMYRFTIESIDFNICAATIYSSGGTVIPPHDTVAVSRSAKHTYTLPDTSSDSFFVAVYSLGGTAGLRYIVSPHE